MTLHNKWFSYETICRQLSTNLIWVRLEAIRCTPFVGTIKTWSSRTILRMKMLEQDFIVHLMVTTDLQRHYHLINPQNHIRCYIVSYVTLGVSPYISRSGQGRPRMGFFPQQPYTTIVKHPPALFSWHWLFVHHKWLNIFCHYFLLFNKNSYQL